MLTRGIALLRGSRGAQVALLLMCATTAACRGPSSQTSPAAASPTPNPYPPTWRFHTEEEWLVAQTVEAIGGMALFASGKSAPTPLVLRVTRAPLTDPLSPRRFTVTLAPGAFAIASLDVPIDDHIWSPKAYSAVARQFVPPGEPASGVGPANSDLPAALLDLRVETLERENRRISLALEKRPLDPRLNEEAALLLGAFALRESSWFFSDVRVALCRLAAHLAVARLGGDEAQTNVGRLAETALDVLALRQKAAVARLDAFVPSSSAEKAWSGALRVGATGDWRALSRPEQASLLERFLHVLALNERLDVTHGQKFIDRAGQERVADWRRLMLSGYGEMNVETCHRYGGWGLREEEGEVLAVWQAHAGSRIRSSEWIDALGMSPAQSPVVAEKGRPERIHVLDLGLWMSFERRAVLNQLRWDDRCLTEILGFDEAGRTQRQASAYDYGRLETYPLVAHEHVGDRASHEAAMTAASALVRAHPELVPAFEWVGLSLGTELGPPAKDLVAYALWFDPYSPFGTAFDAKGRTTNTSFRPLRVSDFKTVPPAQAEMAPYHYELRFRLAQSRGGRISDVNLEVMEPVYRDLAEYDGWALRALAEAAEKYKHPEDYRRYASRLCELNVESCYPLARWLVDRGELDEAAKVYRKWVADARDRVSVSNGVEWLANYEYDHGRRDEAFRLAREAASVYSATGLLTLARLLERTQQLPGAEHVFRDVFDRYETESQYLIGFYRRHVADARLRPGMRQLEHEVFPDGLVRDQASSRVSPPIDGVLIKGSSPTVAEARLQPGNVIVALDGYRVQNLRQYNWVRFLAPDDAPMNLAVWQGSGFADVRANPPQRWFDADFENYKPAP
jgi:hypothetical protein